MEINYEPKGNKFVIKCKPSENELVMQMPERRFRSTTGVWAAPVLRRNIEYMEKRMNNPSMFSAEALKVFNAARKELRATPTGENQFPAWYKFKNDPKLHQKIHMDRAFPLDSYALFFEQGMGKTFTSINLCCAWRMCNMIDSVVVVCPSSIKLVWEEEIEKHSPIGYEFHMLTAGKYKKADEFIATKTDFQWLVVGIEGFSQGNAKDYVKRFMAGRRCAVIIDESSTIKTPDTNRTDVAISLGRLSKKNIILSGTSVTQGLEDLYTQYKFLDPQIIGFNSYYTYRANYCVTISIPTGVDRYGREQTRPEIVGYKNEADLFKSIGPYTGRVEKKDYWAEMPEKIFQNRYVQMNPEQKRLYKEMESDLFIEIENAKPNEQTTIAWYEYEAKGILEKTLRLMQITGGHYPFDDGERVVAVRIPGKNPKVEELFKILDETPGKVIIWCLYRPEIDLIAEELESRGIRYVEYHGGCDDDEKRAAYQSFRKDPKIRVFLASRAAARGLTLVEASVAVYYSTSPSLDDYEQSQDRIHRYGQDRGCLYIHLIAEGTKDKDVFDSLRKKKNIAQLAYDMMKERLGVTVEGEIAKTQSELEHEMQQAMASYEEYGLT